MIVVGYPIVPSVRFLLSVIIFAGVAVQYMQKIDMGIAIVCMVNNTALKEQSKNGSLLLLLKGTMNSEYSQNDTDTCMFKPTHSNSTVTIFNFYFGFFFFFHPALTLKCNNSI
jgi:hypothetical protein